MADTVDLGGMAILSDRWLIAQEIANNLSEALLLIDEGDVVSRDISYKFLGLDGPWSTTVELSHLGVTFKPHHIDDWINHASSDLELVVKNLFGIFGVAAIVTLFCNNNK